MTGAKLNINDTNLKFTHNQDNNLGVIIIVE